jgi:hypothetical protein
MTRKVTPVDIEIVSAAIKKHGINDWKLIAKETGLSQTQCVYIYNTTKKDFNILPPSETEKAFLKTHYGVPSQTYGEKGCTLINFVEVFPDRSYAWIVEFYKSMLMSAGCSGEEINTRFRTSQSGVARINKRPRKNNDASNSAEAAKKPEPPVASPPHHSHIPLNMTDEMKTFIKLIINNKNMETDSDSDNDVSDDDNDSMTDTVISGRERISIEENIRKIFDTYNITDPHAPEIQPAKLIEEIIAQTAPSNCAKASKRANDLYKKWSEYSREWTYIRNSVLLSNITFNLFIEKVIDSEFAEIEAKVMANKDIFNNDAKVINDTLNSHRKTIEQNVYRRFNLLPQNSIDPSTLGSASASASM